LKIGIITIIIALFSSLGVFPDVYMFLTFSNGGMLYRTASNGRNAIA
jgi:hypothetical protein